MKLEEVSSLFKFVSRVVSGGTELLMKLEATFRSSKLVRLEISIGKVENSLDGAELIDAN